MDPLVRMRNVVGILLLTFACNHAATSRAPGAASEPKIHAVTSAIGEQGFVRIGGIEQWITITGANRANPVVLFVHGGPGNAISAYAESMFAGWDKDFTLVQWDQRGAGKTYGRSGSSIEATLTIERMAMDGVEVAEYLTKHLNQKRIILVGSSWGSLLGVHIVKRKPELFRAYVGTAQLVNMRQNLRLSYERVLEYARSIDDKVAVEELTGVGAPPWDSIPKWRTFRKWRNDYQRKLATAEPGTFTRSAGYTSSQDLADEEAADDLNFAHFNLVGTSMTGPLMDVDLKSMGPDFSMPVYVIQGAVDLNAAPEVAREYVAWIKAPSKQFTSVPQSGHADTRVSLEVLADTLLRIRGLANSQM